MVSFVAFPNHEFDDNCIDEITKTINPLSNLETKLFKNKEGLFGCSFHNNAPLKGNKFYEDENYLCLFAGDLIDESIPWEEILEILKLERYEELKKYEGYFAILVLNKLSNDIYLLSDRRSQFPIFYSIKDGRINISTEMSTFCKIPKSFNLEWLWEYLFFNFPIGNTTFLRNVKRMPPASILKFNLENGNYSFIEYASKYKKKEDIIRNEEALIYASKIFEEKISKYFNDTKKVFHPISAGIDSRTILSLNKNMNSVVTYTFGIKGCSDLISASKISNEIGVEHLELFLDNKFEEKLPSLIYDVVAISSGLERVSRSHLLYAFKYFTNNGESYPLTMSGISMNETLRGSISIPFLVSNDTANLFMDNDVNWEFWEEFLGENFKKFKDHISNKIKYLESEHGKLTEPETHLNYVLYEVMPKYFAGEISVSKFFTTQRVPMWDQDILNICYSTENSTIKFSPFLPGYREGHMGEKDLQTFIISKNNDKLSQIPLYGVPPKYYNKKVMKNVFKYTNLVKEIVNGNKPPLEDWNTWLNVTVKDEINDLIHHKESRINNYIKNKDLIDDDLHRLIKITTLEIILRLIENNWSLENNH